MSPSSLLPAAAVLPCTLCFKPRAQPRSSFTLSTCSCFSSSTTFCKQRRKEEDNHVKGDLQSRGAAPGTCPQHGAASLGTEGMWEQSAPRPHLLLLQPPQRVADVLHVLRGQRHQGCVTSPQIHELPRERGENRGGKRGCISPAGGAGASPFTEHDTDYAAPLAWEPPGAPGGGGTAPMECSKSAGEGGGGHTRHAARHWSEGTLRPRTLGRMLDSLQRATGIFNIHTEQTGPRVPKRFSSQRCTHSNTAWCSGYLPRKAEGLSRPRWI